jgi:hypothetical protein
MAINARFQADFSSFLDAIAKADVALVDMSKGASKVEGSLNRMTDGFSGRKLIQEATLMAEAIERAGGVSMLTARELEQVGTKANEATEKMKKLGLDAPPGLQKLADATKTSTGHFESMKSVVTDIAVGLAAMFTVRAAAQFVTDIIKQASALKDLSNQTHINVEEIQLIAGAMTEFGVDADTLAKGLFRLSRGIAGGDESVAHGLHIMGLSFKDVEGLNGQELFLKIEKGLSTLQGGLRDTAAAELFGGKLGAAMAGASEGIEGALATWRRLNHVASTESVDAMDQFGESIARANKNLSSIAANMIGPISQGFNVVIDAANQGASKWAIAVAVLKDFAASNTITGASATNLATLLDHLNQQTEKNTASTVANTGEHKKAVTVLDMRSQAVKFMAALEADAAATLTAAQMKDLEHLKEIGALNAKNAEGIGIATAQYNKYVAGVEAAKKAASDLKEAHAQADQILTATYTNQIAQLQAMETQRAKSYGTAAQIAMLTELDAAEQRLAKSTYAQLNAETERMKVILDAGKQHTAVMNQRMALEEKLLAFTNAAVVAEFQAQTQRNAIYGLDAQGHLKVTSAAETLRLALEALHLTQAAGISQTAQEQILVDAYTQSLYEEAKAQDAVNAAVQQLPPTVAQIPPALQGAAAAFEQFKGVVVAGTGTMVSAFMEVNNAGDWINRKLKMEQAQRDRGDFFLTGFGGGMPTRAAGGPVTAGQTYLVGERGPELFRPSGSGSIAPSSGGSMTNNWYINGSVRDLAQPLIDEITRIMRQGRQWPSA